MSNENYQPSDLPNPPPSTSSRSASLKDDEIKELIAAMKSIHDGSFDRGFKIVGALAIVLGWFAAKTNPLPQLCQSHNLVWVAVLMVILSFIPAIYLYHRDYKLARECEAALEEGGIKAASYSCYRITKNFVTVGLAVQLGMFAFVGLSIFLIYGPENEFYDQCKAAQPAAPVQVEVYCQPHSPLY